MDPEDADRLAWKVAIHPNLVLSLTTSDQGQVGMFPEQINNWNWIRFMCTRAKLAMNINAGQNNNGQLDNYNRNNKQQQQQQQQQQKQALGEVGNGGLNLDDNLSVLNAFAYTGGSTVAALGIQGVNVTHLDASKSFVSWAQRNAEASGLRDRPGARYDFCYYCSPTFLCLCLSLSIYYCPPAFSDTTWHESNHHPIPLPQSINHQSTQYSHYYHNTGT
jgi:hypothetical protein